ncbi:MAG TPA: acetyl-CoA carboxylase biotin carboxylase subunit [Gemmatimonadales bacterium]|nr:acetyl-CoA carboxylase biotin carboxylase subunit [Gemmatimonadales bacterium]
MTKVLIANRGEIALRIIRACHEEGLEAVAVYSDADRLAAHVRAADHAVRLGPAAPAESYLRIDRIVEAARASGATLVHPGYGFLAERAAFADAVVTAGLTFVGPPADAIRAMGDKTSARERMAAAGVPIVPGAHVEAGRPDVAAAAAAAVGFPLVVKASAGGGGRGMRIVRTAAELPGALASAASEAEKAFGDGRVYLERYIERGRHVEVQVLADAERVVHLGERECSIQRRYQKLVEESPSVAVTPELRRALGAAAVSAARAVGYRSAGTIEFLLASDGSFYFLEMNTRIQVEHPVTELVYGVDLVREQLRVAQGLPMRIPDRELFPRGWAIECRITSEDPAAGFLPGNGSIEYLRVPGGPGIRWDGGYELGDGVTLFYDSLIGKLIAWGGGRDEAIARMRRALDEFILSGVPTSIPFHRRLLADAAFARGEIDTQFLERRQDLVRSEPDPATVEAIAVAAALAEDAARELHRPVVADDARARPAWLAAARRESLR